MFRYALRNLLHERTRLGISVGGIALSVVLILVINGIFAGSEEHAVAYIRNQPAPLWLMQSGVENMHMSTSILPPETLDKVRQVGGVDEAVGLLYASGAVDLGDELVYSYIFAVDAGAPFGGPWDLAEGSADLAPDEVVIDKDLAARHGLGLGDTVSVFDHELTIAGLSRETFGIATSITFVNKQALARLMGVSPQASSYILVKPERGADFERLAQALWEAAPEVNLLSRQAFIESDQEMIRQMGADVIRAMDVIAYVVGVLVIGLTIYTTTLERAREFGVLKAIGATTGRLVGVVFVQAFASTVLGALVGVGAAFGLAALIGDALPEMLVLIEADYLLDQLPVVFGIAALAALLPVGRIARLDPMIVFRA